MQGQKIGWENTIAVGKNQIRRLRCRSTLVAAAGEPVAAMFMCGKPQWESRRSRKFTHRLGSAIRRAIVRNYDVELPIDVPLVGQRKEGPVKMCRSLVGRQHN